MTKSRNANRNFNADESDFVCNRCGDGFRTAQMLKQHVRFNRCVERKPVTVVEQAVETEIIFEASVEAEGVEVDLLSKSKKKGKGNAQNQPKPVVQVQPEPVAPIVEPVVEVTPAVEQPVAVVEKVKKHHTKKVVVVTPAEQPVETEPTKEEVAPAPVQEVAPVVSLSEALSFLASFATTLVPQAELAVLTERKKREEYEKSCVDFFRACSKEQDQINAAMIAMAKLDRDPALKNKIAQDQLDKAISFLNLAQGELKKRIESPEYILGKEVEEQFARTLREKMDRSRQEVAEWKNNGADRLAKELATKLDDQAALFKRILSGRTRIKWNNADQLWLVGTFKLILDRITVERGELQEKAEQAFEAGLRDNARLNRGDYYPVIVSAIESRLRIVGLKPTISAHVDTIKKSVGPDGEVISQKGTETSSSDTDWNKWVQRVVELYDIYFGLKVKETDRSKTSPEVIVSTMKYQEAANWSPEKMEDTISIGQPKQSKPKDAVQAPVAPVAPKKVAKATTVYSTSSPSAPIDTESGDYEPTAMEMALRKAVNESSKTKEVRK